MKPRLLPGVGDGEDGGESVASSLADASSMLDVGGADADADAAPASPAPADAPDVEAVDGADGAAGRGACDEVPSPAQDARVAKHVRIDDTALHAQVRPLRPARTYLAPI